MAPDLVKQGLVVKQMEADGNCLFRAMSYFIEGDQDNYEKYRKQTCQHFAKNQKDYLHLFEKKSEFEDYVRRMKQDRMWGGEMEMVALSKIYKCKFIIHSTGSHKIHEVDSFINADEKTKKKIKTYHLAYHLNVIQHLT